MDDSKKFDSLTKTFSMLVNWLIVVVVATIVAGTHHDEGPASFPCYSCKRAMVCSLPNVCNQTKTIKIMQKQLAKLLKSTNESTIEIFNNLERKFNLMNQSLIEISANVTRQQAKLMSSSGNSSLFLVMNEMSGKVAKMENNATMMVAAFVTKVSRVESKLLKMSGSLAAQSTQIGVIGDSISNLRNTAKGFPGVGTEISTFSDSANVSTVAKTFENLVSSRDSVLFDKSSGSGEDEEDTTKTSGVLRKMGRTGARIKELSDAMKFIRENIASLGGKLSDLEISTPVAAKKLQVFFSIF